jgi:hypothetical protein
VCSSDLTVGKVSASSLQEFNVIAFGDLYGTNEVEGRALITGNIGTGVANQIAFDDSALADPSDGVTTPGLNQTDGVIVGGQILSGTTLNLTTNNPNVRVAGADDSATVTTSGTVTYNDNGVSDIITAVTNDVEAMGVYLDGLTTTQGTAVGNAINQRYFDLGTNDVSVAVFDTDQTFFTNSNGSFDLLGNNLSTTDLFVFRVADSTNTGNLTTNSSVNVFSNELGLDDYQRRIIWDFSAFDGELFFTNGLGGALFAPDANVNMGSPIEGTVVANNVTLGAEIHMPYLDSSVLGGIGVTPVPEPSTMMLFGFGMLLVSGIARRVNNRRTF